MSSFSLRVAKVSLNGGKTILGKYISSRTNELIFGHYPVVTQSLAISSKKKEVSDVILLY